jgi:hypothetical protein
VQQVRQLGYVRSDPLRLVAPVRFRRRSPAVLILEIDIGERLTVSIPQTKQAPFSSIDQGGGKRRVRAILRIGDSRFQMPI